MLNKTTRNVSTLKGRKSTEYYVDGLNSKLKDSPATEQRRAYAIALFNQVTAATLDERIDIVARKLFLKPVPSESERMVDDFGDLTLAAKELAAFRRLVKVIKGWLDIPLSSDEMPKFKETRGRRKGSKNKVKK